ncbi:helix-turn-helix domain-containing protein [Mesorhizobium sp. L-8-3]|uniref:helix-turn-helix domain-containing protein n=1 Tax=Mesorhizobium sp. L-8-3 TaxID=2744522 RepID=UPI001925FE1D|nr:helix-turn-helix domain-containing protein [Mesorhizobium sp. L-8-3]
MNPSTIPSSRFSTQQFDIWRESIAVVFDVERLSGDAETTFNASVDAFQLGDMVVTNADLGGQRYVRSSARVRRDGMDHFVLNLYRTGGWRAQTPRGEFEGRAGQVSVLDLSCELVSDEPNCSLVALFLPRSLVEDRLPNLGALHGGAPSGPYAALLAEYLGLLARRLPTLPAGDEQALSRATCEMLTACLAPSLANLEAARPGLELVLQRRAKRFVEAHLHSAKLSTDAICNAVGVSRRTLYRLFDQEGGVLRYIQSRRLERIKTVLSDSRETRRISEVAAEFGFLRSDHFARAFKQQYGQSARDIRALTTQYAEAGAEISPVRPSEGQGFDDWIRALHA